MKSLTIKNLPDSLYQRLKESASLNRRSINSEAIECLEKALRSRRFDPQEFLARADAVRERLDIPPLTEEVLRKAKETGRP